LLESVEAETAILAEPDNENALALLRHPGMRTDHAPFDPVAQLSRQRIANDLKRAALVVALQVLDVLQEERRWSMVGDYARNLKEQGSLRFAEKAMRTTERILL